MIFPGSLRSFSIDRTSKCVGVRTAQKLASARATYRFVSGLQWMYTPRQRDLECLPLMLHCCQTDLDKALQNNCNLGNFDNTNIPLKCWKVNCTIVRNPSTDANASVARFFLRASWQGNIFAISSTDATKTTSSDGAFKSGMSLAQNCDKCLVNLFLNTGSLRRVRDSRIINKLRPSSGENVMKMRVP